MDKSTLKITLLALMLVLTCTKLPSDLDTLRQNIGSTTLLSPADGSMDNILSPVLAWNPVTGATRYSVQVSTSSDFTAIVFQDTIVTDTAKAATGLAYQTMYYWRVQVHDAISSSEWTTHRIFTTIIEPRIPISGQPDDSAKGQPTALVLSWNSAIGAASYCLQVASDSGFVNIAAIDSTLADTSKLIANLSNNMTYYWRVRSQNPGGASVWSAVKRFSTILAAPKVPVTVFPANGATGQQLSLALSWNSVLQASSYFLQVSTDVAFANSIFSDSTLVDTSRTVSGLANSVLYFWRVRAKNEGGVSAWSNFSGFTTLSGLPQTPVLSFPVDGAIGQAIPLVVAWNKTVGAATYHLQVAMDSGFSQISAVDSTLTDTLKSLAGLANSTKYYWRVRAKNPTGVSVWSASRTFVTFAASLQTPVLRSPADGAIDLSTGPQLSWSGVSGAATYRLEVSKSSDFSMIYHQDTALTDTTKTLSGLANDTVFFWHVRAQNASGGMSNWTSPWRFTTIMALPVVPVLVAPSPGAAGQQLSPVLTWMKAGYAATYNVQVAADSGFANLLSQDSMLTDTFKVIAGLSNGTTYFWRVKSKNSAGPSVWSDMRSFTTFAATLQTPTLLTPQDQSTGQSLSSVLTWSTVANATNYQIQVSSARDFTSVVIDDATLTTGSKTLSGLLNSTVYFWHVKAKNLSGAVSNWTDPWSFTTIITTPSAPVLASPNDKAADQPVTATLVWTKATGATSYFVQVATDTGFSTTGIVTADSLTSDTVKAVGGLANSATYYWKVKAKNASGYGNWSVARSFTTIVAAPMSSVLSSPADSAVNVDLNPQLSWAAVTGAAAYHIQVSTAADFLTGLVADDSTYTQTAKVIGPLARNTSLYWHVQAKNAGGTSTWSSRRIFTTIPFPPATPVPSSPADGASDQQLSLTLTWNKSAGASGYYVNVATDTGFSANVKTDSTLLPTDTSKVIGGLANATKYYWRVMAKNAGGSSVWSLRRSFSTIRQFALSITSDSGTVTASPNQAQYDSGTSVLLKEAPAANYHFIGWYGDASGTTDSTVVIMNGPKNVTANFAINAYQLTVNSGANGSISLPTSSPLMVNHGATTGLIASPNTGYDFVNWTVTSGTASIADPEAFSTSVILISGNATVTANFALKTFQLIVKAGTGGTISMPSSSPLWVDYGAATAIMTYTTTGYSFVNWTVTTGNATIANPNSYSTTVTLTSGNASVTANFDTTKYQLTMKAGIGGEITAPLPSPVTVNYSMVTTITASPHTDSSFLKWTVVSGSANIADANSASTTVTLPSDNATVQANFKPIYQWTAANSGLPANSNVIKLAVTGSKIFAGTWGSGVFQSANNGISWTAANFGLPSNAQIQSLTASGSTVFACANGSGVFVSNDTGNTWNAAHSGLPLGVYALAVNGSTIFAGTDSGVFISGNNGSSWTKADSNGTVLSLAVNGANVFAGVDNGGVVVSTDNGTTWAPVNTGLTSTRIWSLAVSGSYIFAGAYGGGVFYSANSGTSWSAANAGLTSVNVMSLAAINSELFAGTGSGIFFSSNSGAAWAGFSSGLTNNNVQALAICGNNIFAGTNGGGVFRSSLP